MKYIKGQIHFPFVLVKIPCNSRDANKVTPKEQVEESGSTATTLGHICVIIENKGVLFVLQATLNTTSHFSW